MVTEWTIERDVKGSSLLAILDDQAIIIHGHSVNGIE